MVPHIFRTPKALHIPFRILDIGQKELGMFPTEEICCGDLIWSRHPLLVYPQVLPYHNEHLPGQGYSEVDAAVSQLCEN